MFTGAGAAASTVLADQKATIATTKAAGSFARTLVKICMALFFESLPDNPHPFRYRRDVGF
jgi:hypothetical protein